MGAWIALRLAQRLPGRIQALLLLAPAPDFTSRLVEPKLTAEDRAALQRDGFIAEPSPYSDQPTVYTRKLIEDGALAAVMTGPIALDVPVHIIQGMEDPDVPHTHALDLVSLLPSAGVTLTLVKDGDHRLSRPRGPCPHGAGGAGAGARKPAAGRLRASAEPHGSAARPIRDVCATSRRCRPRSPQPSDLARISRLRKLLSDTSCRPESPAYFASAVFG